MPYVPQDFHFKEARRLGYVARSAFKLLEIQSKHKVIIPGGSILDLGCAPGAWLQVACKSLGPKKNGGSVVGVDLKDTRPPGMHCDERVKTLQGDVFSLNISRLRQLSPLGYTTVLSDMCPATSGVGTADVAKSLALGQRALELAAGNSLLGEDSSEAQLEDPLLVPGGAFVVKLLEGAGIQEYVKLCRREFSSVSWLRSTATRSESREVYIIGTAFQGKLKLKPPALG